MKKLSFIIIITIISFSSCKKDKPDKLEGEKSILIGTWHWKYSERKYNICNNNPMIETLNTELENKDFSVIVSDEGYASFFKNESIISKHEIQFEHFLNLGNEGYKFSMELTNAEGGEDVFSGSVLGDSIRSSNFPFRDNGSGCEQFKNYLFKE